MILKCEYYLDLYEKELKKEPSLEYEEFYQRQWLKEINELYKYFIFHGDLNMPEDYEIHEVKLGKFLNTMCEEEDNLTPNQRKTLLSLKFDFTPRVPNQVIPTNINTYHQDKWKNHLKIAKKFYNKYHHLRVMPDFKMDGENLGAWIERQRQTYKIGRLYSIREQMLDEVGMIYSLCHLEEVARICQLPKEASYLPVSWQHIQFFSKNTTNDVDAILKRSLLKSLNNKIPYFKIPENPTKVETPETNTGMHFYDILESLRDVVIKPELIEEIKKLMRNLTMKQLEEAKKVDLQTMKTADLISLRDILLEKIPQSKKEHNKQFIYREK